MRRRRGSKAREDADARRPRESGKGLGVTLFDSEEAMRRGDEALERDGARAPSERRASVEFFEVPVQTVTT